MDKSNDIEIAEGYTPPYSIAEETANSITHGLGAVGSIVGLAFLAAYAAKYGTAVHMTAAAIFGASLIILYTASTLYHAIPMPKTKAVFKVLDHSAIFILIAGTYTPIALVALPSDQGIPLLVIAWSLALFGIIFKLFNTGKYDFIGVLIYLGMGWMIVFYGNTIIERVPEGGLWLIAAGGLAYTGGVVFYLWEKLPFNHAIWHLFVLAGSVLHYLGILIFIMPGPMYGMEIPHLNLPDIK